MLENQCVSLELARKLKELGIKTHSLFVWEYHDKACYGLNYFPFALPEDNGIGVERCHAYTAQELWSMINDYSFYLNKDGAEKGTRLYFSPEHGTDNSYIFTDNNIANNLANMIIAQHRENEDANKNI